MVGIVLQKGTIRIRATAVPQIPNPKGRKWLELTEKHLPLLSLGECSTKPVARLTGPAISGCYPMINSGTNYTYLTIVLCRLCRPLPPCASGIWDFVALFKDLLTPNHRNPPPRMSDADFLAGVEPRRRMAIKGAQELWIKTGWRPKYGRFKAFKKTEKVPGFWKKFQLTGKADYLLARMINGPHDVVHVRLGPWMKPMLNWLKSMWGPEDPYFYAAATPTKLHKWLQRLVRFGPGLYVWGDISQCESSITGPLQDFVESFYWHFINEPEIRDILDAIRSPSGTIGDIKFQAREMNGSGRPDTSLMTTLCVGFAFVLSLTAAWNGIPLRNVTEGIMLDFFPHTVMAGCGDDNLSVVASRGRERDAQVLVDLRSNMAELGFKIKAFASYKLQDCVFLAHRPLPVNGVWYWMKTHGRCLYKLGWQEGIKGDPRAYMNGVMLQLKSTTCAPILLDIANAWLEQNAGAKVTLPQPDPNKPWEEMGKINPGYYADDTVAALAEAYSHMKDAKLRDDLDTQDVYITPQDVRFCIQEVVGTIVSAGGIPCVLDHWLLRHMVYEDEL